MTWNLCKKIQMLRNYLPFSEDLGTFDQINYFFQFWVSDALYKAELALLWNVLKENIIHIARMLDYKGIADHSATA